MKPDASAIFDRLGLRGSLVLAPIAGYSDSPFRQICLRHGAALVVTELLSAEGVARNSEKTLELARFDPEERPIALQVFGHDMDVMARAAEKLGREREPDLIDINMGCPARKVVKGGSGSALLMDPEKMTRLTRAVVEASPVPVSVKLRIGWNDTRSYPLEYVDALEEGGAAFMAVHGRTREQMYGGEADWEVIGEMAARARIPLIGNGDITSHREAREKMEKYGCDAVMIGRGALGNPWIFSGGDPGPAELLDQIERHLYMMTQRWGDHGVMMMRKHLVKYIHGRPGAAKLRSLLMKLTEPGEIVSTLGAYLGVRR